MTPEGEVTTLLLQWVRERWDEWDALAEQITHCDQQMRQWYQTTPACIQEEGGWLLFTTLAAHSALFTHISD